MIKIGRTSAPGTNSTKDTNPIQRNMAKQTKIPATSNTSPTTGIVNTTATYSITSSITQKISDKSSISVKTKYFTKHKEEMEKKGLIKVEIKGWKKGQKKLGRTQLLSITPKGIKWLVISFNSAIEEILGALPQTLDQLTHITDVKKSFRKNLSRISGEDFELAKNDAKTMFEPFWELFRNMIILQLWLQPNYHPLAGVAPWMQLLESEPPTPELSLEEAKHIVESNYFLFGPNMEGYIPLPSDVDMKIGYAQAAWNFVESLSKHKGDPLPPPPLKRSEQKSSS